jgi:hypothetical protein
MYIYLIQERESIRCNDRVYKIGKTRKDCPNERTVSYPKGSCLVIALKIDDENAEKNLLMIFREKFVEWKDNGNEYFKGDPDDMIAEIENYRRKFCESKKSRQERDKTSGEGTADDSDDEYACEDCEICDGIKYHGQKCQTCFDNPNITVDMFFQLSPFGGLKILRDGKNGKAYIIFKDKTLWLFAMDTENIGVKENIRNWVEKNCTDKRLIDNFDTYWPKLLKACRTKEIPRKIKYKEILTYDEDGKAIVFDCQTVKHRFVEKSEFYEWVGGGYTPYKVDENKLKLVEQFFREYVGEKAPEWFQVIRSIFVTNEPFLFTQSVKPECLTLSGCLYDFTFLSQKNYDDYGTETFTSVKNILKSHGNNKESRAVNLCFETSSKANQAIAYCKTQNISRVLFTVYDGKKDDRGLDRGNFLDYRWEFLVYCLKNQ